ncbi:MAG: phosphoribosylanthranilate isomerase, partial [Myxococcales bacterium]|nr:phosphoribosylanthranilate isomerase [Myxococcales bacterium]
MRSPIIKVCGVRTDDVVVASIEAGATHLGLNFVTRSRRRVDLDAAIRLAQKARSLRSDIKLVAVVCDQTQERIEALIAAGVADILQLHGDEPPSEVSHWLARGVPTIKAVGLAPGEGDDALVPYLPWLRNDQGPTASMFDLLIDAKVGGRSGGTGTRIDLERVTAICASSPVIVAGGLNSQNVGDVIVSARPLGVDAASAAEDDGGEPSADRAAAFASRAKSAFD